MPPISNLNVQVGPNQAGAGQVGTDAARSGPVGRSSAAPPFAIIMVCACISLWRSLVKDEREGKL